MDTDDLDSGEAHPYFGELNTPFEIPASLAKGFQRDGFVIVRGLLSASLVAAVRRRCDRVIEEAVWDVNSENPYRRAFRYLMNARLRDSIIDRFSRSRRLAGVALRLLGARGVRLSHDQLLYKPPHAGVTPIHADQYHWPVSDDATVTAWIPLQATSSEMGSLSFYKGSQQLDDATRTRICSESNEESAHAELLKHFPLQHLEYADGDVSFHRGWTFHRALGNQSDATRRALSVVYMSEDIRIVEPRDGTPLESLAPWCPGAVVGGFLNPTHNPLVIRQG